MERGLPGRGLLAVEGKETVVGGSGEGVDWMRKRWKRSGGWMVSKRMTKRGRSRTRSR